MYWEVAGSILASLGGASLLIAGLSHFLGTVWADRIAKQTMFKYERDIQSLKNEHQLAIEEFQRKAAIELASHNQFSGISLTTYQDFFRNRIETYTSLLKVKDEHISVMHEDLVTEQTERWADAYYASYVRFREIITKKQLYVSTDLERIFHDFRLKAAPFILQADYDEAMALANGAQSGDADEERSEANEKLIKGTHELMQALIKQIDDDVSRLRARVELDKA